MSSFRKPGSQQPKIPGTNTSLHNGQLLTSTGNPSLDHILGGGLVIGSLLLIEEDKFVSYSKVLSKYFLAEGLVLNHALLVASLDDDPKEFVKKVPSPIAEHQKTINKTGDAADENMRIAFRYNNLPKVNSVQEVTNLGHHFDLTTPVDQATIDRHDIEYWGEATLGTRAQNLFHNPKYLSLLDAIRLKAQQPQFTPDGSEKNILRVSINSIGSPLWYDDHYAEDLCKFFAYLKAITRQHQIVCCITLPMHLLTHLEQPHLVSRIRHMVDYSVQLEAFAGSDKETNPYFKEYHGLLHIQKLAALNTFAAFTPETYDLAFKLRRRKFVIEKLHLPPELQEAEHQDKIDAVPSISCGGGRGGKNSLDF